MTDKLKYYLRKTNNQIYLDSTVNINTDLPKDFVKWYEEGDIDWNFSNNSNSNSYSPIFNAMFAPQRLNEKLIELLK